MACRRSSPSGRCGLMRVPSRVAWVWAWAPAQARVRTSMGMIHDTGEFGERMGASQAETSKGRFVDKDVGFFFWVH